MKKVIDNNQSELKGFRKIRKKMKKVQKENILITFQFRLQTSHVEQAAWLETGLL